MGHLNKVIYAIEIHSAEGIRECFSGGLNPNISYKGRPLFDELTGQYLRGSQFKACVKAFVDYGLNFPDETLLAVLLDDAAALANYLAIDSSIVDRRYSMKSAFTPLHEVTLLHICAEFNHVSCAELLMQHDADINAFAGVDENGFGRQTPIFHTVNQILNQSAEMLRLLLSREADLQHTVAGLIWGKQYDWETFIPSVNPISYAMMGLLPQMHRNEKMVAETVSLLMQKAYGIAYSAANVPNRYLQA
jgi:Ankyrin repeat